MDGTEPVPRIQGGEPIDYCSVDECDGEVLITYSNRYGNVDRYQFCIEDAEAIADMIQTLVHEIRRDP